MTDFEDITKSAWANAIDEAVRSVIDREVSGSALNNDIQQVLKEKARKLIDENAELQAMIIAALKSWISTQSSEDVRKERAENQRRFGNR